ncbi:hypothetical protein IDH44_01305 [Paenibacillus sp. IB182496]|uniref:Copper amine oxidase-like N-terminal domain-containing protein n=1 Tax=Paenibacillus sabuli TaxID=2772509 RepID=A0A927BQR0_9BACL|nr:hypothetical protein [Paenibacillus sabuli]MBD2843814.1 hypothetical protein [Paenibacillus sabuli]
MKKTKWLITATVGGLLLTTAAAGADSIAERVDGWLRGDVNITIDGETTGLHPVYIDGKAYLPVREAAGAMGYNVNWSKERIALEQEEGQPVDEEEEALLQLSGVISSLSKTDDGYRLEVLGHGTNQWMVLHVDEETVVSDSDGNAAQGAALEEGMRINAQYGPIIAMSYPGQSHAASIEIVGETLVREDAAFTVEQGDDGWQLQFAELQDSEFKPVLTLNGGKETLLITAQGTPVDWHQIVPGTKVKAYYGPMMTKSLPPQSPAHVIVVQDEALNIDQDTVDKFRDIAWELVPEQELEHLQTTKEEAQISWVSPELTSIMPADDDAKQVIEDVTEQGGQLISALYATDQDALLGPLQIVMHPDTGELLGFFIRM